MIGSVRFILGFQVVLAALTAYDTQKLKRFAASVSPEQQSKVALKVRSRSASISSPVPLLACAFFGRPPLSVLRTAANSARRRWRR